MNANKRELSKVAEEKEITQPQKDIIEAIKEESGSYIQINDIYYGSDGFQKVVGLQWGGYENKYIYIKYTRLNKDDVYSTELSDFVRYYVKFDIPQGKTVAEAIADIENEAIESLRDPSKIISLMNDLGTSGSDAIISVGNKGAYEKTLEFLGEKERRVTIMTRILKDKMGSLSAIKKELAIQIKKVQRVIGIIELYLGVHEEIIQIQSGAPADKNEPISIRQQILWMDEEAGILDDGGIDCQRIDDFDAWLLEKGHIDRVLPEKKGIVVLRPSRQTERYVTHSFENFNIQLENKMAYLLIRNGDNLYRVWTNENMGKRFFPTLKEAEHIEVVFEEASKSGYYNSSVEKVEEEKFNYIRNTFIIQGLIDRTQLFEPLPVDRIDFFSPETYGDNGLIRLIRDDESLLPTGRIPYKEWRTELNSHIERGSQIYFSKFHYWEKVGEMKSYYLSRFPHYVELPEPEEGIYTIEHVLPDDDFRDGRVKFKILYMPTNEWRWEGERKRRVSFELYPSDDNVLLYDRISPEDLEYYINSRSDRANYLYMLPVLVGMRRMRYVEIEQEKQFIALLQREINLPEEKIWNAVDWWKNKVIWKRPLKKDDELAWRMIRKRLAGETE